MECRFEYTDSDLLHSTDQWNGKKFQLSKFDELLHSKWDQAVVDGHFRYKLDEVETKILEGDKHYVAQLNVKRATHRRQPDMMRNLNQPFNPDLFNFAKIKSEEILFLLRHTGEDAEKDEPEQKMQKICQSSNGECREAAPRNLLIINISPLGYGHVLMVPDVDSCKPQVLTEYGIRLSIETMLLSSHCGFRVGFNSLCALASVNHQHVHAYYLDHELYTEYCEVKPFVGVCYELTCMPTRGFAFQLHGSNVRELSRVIHSITSHFTQAEIAHNLFFTRGTVFGEPRNSEKRTLRLYLWPRTPFYFGQEENGTGMFNVATAELGGHLPVKVKEGFHSFTEADVDKELGAVSLSEDEFENLKRTVKELVLKHSDP